jgi:GxxExxY protein
MRQHGELLHGDITDKILGAFYQVHFELGFGFLESVYSRAIAHLLVEGGLHVKREVPIAVHFRGMRLGAFRADLIVEEKVLVELKASPVLDPSAEAQLLNYLRATNLQVGLVLHFGEKAQFRRRLYTNDRKFLLESRE